MIEHAARNHAILSASGSHRWLNCPPSAMLEMEFPNTPSEYAEEGTYMHELCEYKIRHDYFCEEDVPKPESEKWYSEEVDEVTDIYYNFVVETIEKMDKPIVLLEERLDFSHIVPNGFGTGDMVLISDGIIHVIDFKGGRNVRVDATRNSQMMLYALGALKAYDFLWNVKTIRMSIVQPRLNNISTFECSREELVAWGESIKPIAALAIEGKGQQNPGDWCKFCRAKAVCRARADEALSEFSNLDQKVSIDELAEMLPKLERIQDWITSVFEYAADQAINHNVEIQGYEVVEGKANRKFSDEEAVAKTAIENGYSDIYKKELLSPAAFEKMMGKTTFAELLSKYVVRPQGKKKLSKKDLARKD